MSRKVLLNKRKFAASGSTLMPGRPPVTDGGANAPIRRARLIAAKAAKVREGRLGKPVDIDDGQSISAAAAARLAGVTEEALLAWERRYGLPSPERRYSRRQILALATLVARAESGESIGQLIRDLAAELLDVSSDEHVKNSRLPETRPSHNMRP